MYHIYPESVKAIDPDKWFDLSQWFSSSYLMLKKASDVIWRGQEHLGRTVDTVLERSWLVGVCERKKKKTRRVLLYVSQEKGHWNIVPQIRRSLWITIITDTWCDASHFKGYKTIWPTFFSRLASKSSQAVYVSLCWLTSSVLFGMLCLVYHLVLLLFFLSRSHWTLTSTSTSYLFQTRLYHFSPVLSHQQDQEDFGYLKFYWLFERYTL